MSKSKSDWDKDEAKSGEDHSEEDKNGHEEPEVEMTPLEAEMSQVLNRKKQEVIKALLISVSSTNKDLEECLNAHTVLMELVENQSSFGQLSIRENMMNLIESACDLNNRH